MHTSKYMADLLKIVPIAISVFMVRILVALKNVAMNIGENNLRKSQMYVSSVEKILHIRKEMRDIATENV
jgi:hypothetical protein